MTFDRKKLNCNEGNRFYCNLVSGIVCFFLFLFFFLFFFCLYECLKKKAYASVQIYRMCACETERHEH